MHSLRIRSLLLTALVLLPACSFENVENPQERSTNAISSAKSTQPSKTQSEDSRTRETPTPFEKKSNKAKPTTAGTLDDAIAFASSLSKSYPELKPHNVDPTVYLTRTGKKRHADGCRHLRKSRIPVKLSSVIARYGACKHCGGGGTVRIGKPATWENANYSRRTAEWTVNGVFDGNRTEAVVFLNRQNRWSVRSLKIGKRVVFRDKKTPSHSRFWDARVETKRSAREKIEKEKAAKEKAEREWQAMTAEQRAKEEKLKKIAHNEQRAAARLRLAKTLKDKQKRIKWFTNIIKNYPGTKAAKDAEKLLKEARKSPVINVGG